MKALFRVIRYSSVGVFLAGIFTTIVGCSTEDQIRALILFILLLLSGGGATDTDSATAPESVSSIAWGNFVDNTITACAIGASPCTTTTLADNATTGVSQPRGVMVVGTTLYWVNDGDDTIRRCTIGATPCTSTTIADNGTSGVATPFGLFVVGSTL